MTQHAERTFTTGRIALLVAALAAAFTVGFAISRSHGENPPAAGVGSADAATAPGIADLEKATQANPDDSSAWQDLGLAYFSESRFADAARAYGRAADLAPDDASAWSALGEAKVMASERDPMPEDAATAFERAISLDSKDPRARYFLAVKRDLGGDHEGAIADWLALLEDTPADAPWRGDLVRTIEQVGKINAIDVAGRLDAAGAKSPSPSLPPSLAAPLAAQAIPGPSAQDLAAAAAIPPSEQREMAEGMVSRLESRLEGDPKNVNGWIMLIRSRATLEQPARARKALADAVAANPDQAEFIRQQARTLGVGE